jgi:hypothetical protein
VPVLSHDHVCAKAHCLAVLVDVNGDIVERALQSGELCVHSVGSKDALVERRQDGIAHTIPPAKVSQLPRCVSRAPLAARSAHLSCGCYAHQVNFDGRRFWEHAKAEDVIGAASRRGDERDLARDPRTRKGNPRTWAEVDHSRTVAVWGRGPKRQD